MKRYTLTPSRREIGRSLGRKQTHSFARYVIENTEVRQRLILRFNRLLQAEMKALYSEQALLNNDLNIATLSTFTWDRLSLILHQKAPVLLGFLNSCIPRGSKRRNPILVVCIAILINSHRRTTVIQAIASVILYLGHAGKQVRLVSYHALRLSHAWMMKTFRSTQDFNSLAYVSLAMEQDMLLKN